VATAYKVLKDDLSSLRLLGAPHFVYSFGMWNLPLEPLSGHPRKGGGIWVAPTLSAAKKMVRYMKKAHGVSTRIFRCEIGRILHRTSCRIKTDKIFFTQADEITQ